LNFYEIRQDHENLEIILLEIRKIQLFLYLRFEKVIVSNINCEKQLLYLNPIWAGYTFCVLRMKDFDIFRSWKIYSFH